MNDNEIRSFLIDQLNSRFLSYFVDKGFSIYPLSTEEKNPELSRAFPLGRLKKDVNGELQLVELQFDKHGEPKFVVNFGVVPKGGVTLPWGKHLKQDEADTSALEESYRLYANASSKKWFCFGVFTKKNEANAINIVDTVIEYSFEIDEWFASGKPGKHCRKFG